ncbi:RHS repeat-associated core domain-containing protein [Candidatus Formimonas warabiya]|uniref:Teneurin-like YD-shell domain-containing protein n=1 Tax=Formimonas warabiya TaxID=1761012 RepID=A0A3G1KXQ1_FORW1|nr:LamG-like jellyroll fold domain-containing protein [Candidatus Formimonas warabiya]ATW27221.1 hypothetical protein DCMF_22900 [Candidatus Formimonas warabiya]
MKKQRICLKIFNKKPALRAGKKFIGIITILALLASNVAFIPNAYAANISSVSDSSAVTGSFEKWIAEYRLADQLVASLKPSTSQTALSPELPDLQESLSESVYAKDLNPEIPAIIDKEIDYPAFQASLTPDKQDVQTDGVFMRHVIHMPDVVEKPVPFTPNNAVINQHIPDQPIDQNNGSSIIQGLGYQGVYDSPNTFSIRTSEEGMIDENDLNLISADLPENSDQNESSVSDSVYRSVYGKGLSSPADLNQESIVNRVYDALDDSFPIHNKGGYFSAGFSRRAGGNLLQFSLQDANLTLGPENADSVSGTVYKNSIIYEDIYPETDLRYTVEPLRLKEELIVNRYTGQNEFAFQLSVSNAVYQVIPDSIIMFSDPDSEQPLFYIPKSYAIDSEGNRCDNITMEFVEEGLLISVDADWLEHAAYPVIIDPTINLFDATFTRSSIAYKQDGTQVASGTPRYETTKFNQGIMIEEGTTNLWSEALYIYNNYGADIETSLVALSETYMGQPVYRLSMKPKTIAARDGLRTEMWSHGVYGSYRTYSGGNTYTASIYWRQAGSKTMEVGGIASNVPGWTDIGTYDAGNGWKRSSAKWYDASNRTDNKYWSFRCPTVELNETVYIDWVCPQIEQKSYATSWLPSGTTRSPETLTIPTAGVFQKGNWAVELTFTPTSSPQNTTNRYARLWRCKIDANNDYIIFIDPSGRVYGGVHTGGTWYGTILSVPLAAGNSYSVSFSGNGSVLRLCVNGTQVGTDISYVEPVGTLPAIMTIGYDQELAGTQINGIIDDLRISNRARTAAEALTAYQSNQPLPVDTYTTCKLNFNNTLHANPTINSTNAIFTRSSKAYKQDNTEVTSGTPRYEAGKFNQSITIEEGTRNFFDNPSFEDGKWPDFDFGGANYPQLRTSTARRIGGVGCQLSGGKEGSFIYQCPPQADQLYYSQSYYVKRADGLPLQMTDIHVVVNNTQEYFDSITAVDHGWYLCKKENVQNTTTASTWGIYVIPNLTIYIDECQVERKPYCTSYIEGTRNDEILTIPTSRILNPDQGTIEQWAYIDPNGKHSASIQSWTMPFSVATVQSSPYAELNQISIRRLPLSTSWEVLFSNAAGSSSAVSLGNITTPGWYCFGVKWQQGVGGYGYLNGVLKGSVAPAYLPSEFTSTAYIGSWCSGNQFDSILDDFRISSIARSDSDILANYQSNQPFPLDIFTTFKLNFDGGTSGYTTVQSGPGMESYWNYTSMNLGGGWNASVNTWNQNLILTKPLFSIPGRGLAIGENIAYNSISKTWTFGNNTSLVENQDGSVTYNKGDGGAYTFTPNGSGGYTAPAGVYLTLQKNSTGNFTIFDKYKNTYNYVNRKPNQFTDRNNNITTFTYDSNGRLYQVSDPSGRKLTYTYNGLGNISSVTDPANHSYQFGYQNGNLTSVTDPDNKTFNLSYDANGHVLTFTDPLNRVTSFYSDPNGQIQRLRDARTNGQDVYETSFSQALQGNSILTMMTDPGNKTSIFSHDSNTGNLTQYQDALGHNWQYTWTANNLMQSQDAKGTTSYQYDTNGNITCKTITVDSSSSHNIIETMTYDSYSQLLQEVDGSGRTTSYKYSNKGELLSTATPDIKESNGRKYDQYGNVIEYSPTILGTYNLLENGSMEIPGTGSNLLAGWSRLAGAASVSLEGFNSHGNSALKISSDTPTTDRFYQRAGGISTGDKLVLRADIKLDNVQPSSSDGGVLIRLLYVNGAWEYWYIWGSGTVPVNLTSNSAAEAVTVYIGLSNASGTVWIDGVQLEDTGYSSGRYILSNFNSVENSGFEESLDNWSYTGTTPTVTSEAVWGGAYSLKIQAAGTIYQNVPVYGGEPLTFSGMVKTSNVTGNGACYKIDYYDSGNNLITGSTVQTGYVTGTQDFTMLTSLASAPANARYARVQGILDGSGTIYFDTVKLVPRNSEKYTYDSANGNYTGKNYITTSEDALGKQNNYTYNINTGSELSFTDARNRTTYYGYDNLNRLIQVTDPLSHTAYYGYDAADNCTSTRDPRSSSPTDNTYLTGYGPNNLNKLGTLTDPLSRNYTYTYDRSGNLTDILLPNGLTEHFDYDNANRLIKTSYGNGKYFTYTYDNANELISVTDQDNNSFSCDYDRAHRLTSTTDNFGYSLTYQWDKSNNLTSLTASGMGSCQYAYGSDNELLFINLPDGSYIYYDYDENGRVFQVRYPGSYNYRKYSYLANGWCIKIQDPCFPGQYNYNYDYNNDGTISSYTSWVGSDSFSYDADGRLTYWRYSPTSGNSIQENYSYDHAGNLLTKGSRTFTYNSANQITNTGYTYDNNGNMTGDGTYIYSYNALNQLIQVKKASDNSLIADYTYNHDGLRRSKTVYVGSSQGTTNYSWDASGNLVREVTPSGTNYYYYDTSSAFIGLKKNNTTYIVHNNLRGDIESITDTSGNIVAQYHFDPWGNQITYSGSLTQPFRYASYYFDDETGLYYLKSGYYSPALGRFLTKDSIEYIKHEDPQTLNLYTYCGNDPVNNVDPDGNFQNAAQNTVIVVEAVVITIIYVSYKLTEKAIKDAITSIVKGDIGMKKQGRERIEKKKNNPEKKWKDKSNKPQDRPIRPNKHTPSKDHQKYIRK